MKKLYLIILFLCLITILVSMIFLCEAKNSSSVVLPTKFESCSFNKVVIVEADKTYNVLASDMTTGELLTKLGKEIYEKNKLVTQLDNKIVRGTILSIDYIEKAEEIVEESIPFEVKYNYVDTIPKGLNILKTSGEDGVKEYIYETIQVNGEYTQKVLKEVKIQKEAIDEEYDVGVGGTFEVDGKTYNYSYYVDCTATYYTKDSSPTTWGYYTFTGKAVDETCIAVDPTVIPLLSNVYIKTLSDDPSAIDYGERTAYDIGGGIVGQKIDVYFETEDNVDRYFWYHGIINVRVYILE